MNKEVVKGVIREFQEGELPEVVPREVDIPLSSQKIVAIVGPRRSGKTYLLFSLMKKLQSLGIPRERIVYLSFDDPRLLPCRAADMELILEAYRELYPEHMRETSYVFLDEIQNVADWEIGVRRIYDTRRFRVFLTGSSSKLLSREIATQLRGRAINFEILPFSFREVLTAKGIRVDTRTLLYSLERFPVSKHLYEYLETGGFPEVVLEENPDVKLRILREYLEVMYFRDLIERYSIKNQVVLRELIKFLVTNMANLFSLNAFFRWIKEVYPVTKRTLLSYALHLEDVGLFSFVRKFSYSLKEQVRNPRKCYLLDNGLRTVYGFQFSKDLGKCLENTVFLELRHRKAKRPSMEVFYWQNSRKREVDFVVTEGESVKELIQVCAEVSSFRVEEREVTALLKASEELGCDKLTVVTLDYEGEKEVGGKRVVFKKLLRWLLEEG